MRKARIAAAILAKNDESQIENTIRSVAPFAKKIYVLDCHSTDKTQEIAEKHGATVVKANAYDNFAFMKNELLEKIEADDECDCVLWMNASELFDWNTLQLFQSFLENGITANQSYMLIVRRCLPEMGVSLLQSAGMTEMESRELRSLSGLIEREEETIELRLTPLNRNLRFSGRICETCFPALEASGIGINAAPGRILQLSPVFDAEKRELQARETINLFDLALKNGEPISDEMYLEQAKSVASLGSLGYLECIPMAKHLFQGILDRMPAKNVILETYYKLYDLWQLERVAAGRIAAIALEGKSPQTQQEFTEIIREACEKENIRPIIATKTEEQINKLADAIDIFPTDLQLLSLLAGLLQRQRQLDLAVRTLETALKYGQINFDVWHRWRIRTTSAVHLSLLHRMKGEPDKAISALESYWQDSEGDAEVARYLLDLYILKNEREKGLAFAAKIWSGEKLKNMQDVIAGACNAATQHWEKAIPVLYAALNTGCKDPLCLRWLSVSLLSSSRFADAKPILEKWVQAEPNNVEPRSFLFALQTPERFCETLKQINRAQLEALGVESISVYQTKVQEETPNDVWTSLFEPLHPLESAAEETETKNDSEEYDFDFEFFSLNSSEEDATTDMRFQK